MNPEMQEVVSSNVARIGYVEETEDVYVEFIGGGVYVYSPVAIGVWWEFEAADSKGKFVNEVLKPSYACVKQA